MNRCMGSAITGWEDCKTKGSYGLLALAMLVSTTAFPLRSQSASPVPTPEDQSARGPVFKSEAREVSVVFRVVDKKNQAIDGITSGEIHIDDEGISRIPTSFAANVAHAHVVILADVSGSMATVLEPLEGALSTFADLVSKDIDREPGDILLTLVPFGDTAEILVDRTPNAMEFKEAVTRLRPSGTTALVDTILGALLNAFRDQDLPALRKPAKSANQDMSPIPSEFRRKRPSAGIEGAKRSKFLVIFSDAGENASGHKWSDIASALLGKEVTIYSVAFDSGTPDANLSMLSNITAQSGGKVYRAKAGDLERIYSQIAHDIRSHYQLTFAASDVENRRRWRRIRLAVDRPEVTIFARSGYCPETPCQKPDGSFMGGQPTTWNEVLAINRDPGLIFSVREHLRALQFQYTAETERIVKDLSAAPLLIERVSPSRGKRSATAEKFRLISHTPQTENEDVDIDAEVCGIRLDSEAKWAPQIANNGPVLAISGAQPLIVLNPEIRLARRPGSGREDDSSGTAEAYFQSQAVFSLRDPSGRIPSLVRVQCNRPHFLISDDLVQFAADAVEQALKATPVKSSEAEHDSGGKLNGIQSHR
jgi:VWFA-related protein